MALKLTLNTDDSGSNVERTECSHDVHHIVPECKDSGIEERGSLSLTAYSYLVYRPAREVTWKGGFKIHDECYGGFWGQPPFRVHCKAYECSKTLYPVLEVKLVSRCHLWTSLFCGGNPDFCDIGLYFLPGDSERSKDNLASLFELMESQDVAMEICISGVELLIFTSSKLHLNSEMLIDEDDGIAKSSNNRFLWGVFRPGREHQTGKEKPIHCSSPTPIDGDGEDMEIDMVGGLTVGSVDVPVPCRQLVSDETTLLQSTRFLDSTLEQRLHMDVPPGFEKISRPKAMESVKVEKMDV